jgi:hypothetical protein
MFTCLLCFAGAFSSFPTPGSPGIALNAAAQWYKEAKPPETTIEGVVKRTPTTGRIGPPSRFNPFQFTWTDATGQTITREIHAPDKAHLLADYLEQRVRLVGKIVSTEEDSKVYHEFWPARLDSLKGPATKLQPQDGVLARTSWHPPAALRTGKQTLVLRDGAALARFMRVTGDDADRAATGLLAKQLDVPTIDWDKQMVLHVCAGLKTTEADRLAVTRVTVKDKELIVTYHLIAPEGGATGFGYPAETVLVERYEGVVRFEEEKRDGK